jgi:uncharacterized membrane protein YbhN (UPF0104 family)
MSQSVMLVMLFLLQCVGTGGLLVALVSTVDWEQFYSLLVISQKQYIALSLILVAASHALNLLRWAYFLRGHDVSYSILLSYYGAGLFSNNFLPTGIGGDGVRVLLLSRQIAPAQAVLSVVLDRSIGTLALGILFAIALGYGLPPGLIASDRWWGSIFNVAPVVYFGGSTIVGMSFCGLLGWRFFPAIRDKVGTAGAFVADTLTKASWTKRSWWKLISGAYVLSLLSHLSIIAAHWAVAEAFRIAVPGISLVWLVLIGALSLFVPFTINGVGLQESVYVILLGCYGISSSMALAMAIVLRLLLIGFGVIGGILSLRT